MKKTFNLFSFAVLSMTALVACSELNLENDATKNYFYNFDPAAASLVASTQSNIEAKSQLSSSEKNPDVYWTEGDKVSVFQLQEQEYKNISFTTATDKATTASFTEDVTGSFDSEIETAAYAVYPYSESNAVAVVDGEVTVTAEIPAVQTATNNSFAEETNLAVGVLEGGNVAFKNVCAYMRFYVTNGGKVQSITITGKNGEYVAGKVSITFNDKGEPVATPIEGESSKSITLTCPEGQNGFTKGHTYYVAVMPQVFQNGVILTINTVQDEVKVGGTSLSNTNPIVRTSGDTRLTLVRNNVKRFPYWDDRIEWRSAMILDFENRTSLTTTTDIYNGTGSESSLYSIVGSADEGVKTSETSEDKVRNTSDKVMKVDASKVSYSSGVNNARFMMKFTNAFASVDDNVPIRQFNAVRMKVRYVKDADENYKKYFPRVQLGLSNFRIKDGSTNVTMPWAICSPTYVNGHKMSDVYVFGMGKKSSNSGDSEAISETYEPITTYNAVTSDWVTEYQTAINYDGWNDLIYLIGDISSNPKFVKGLTYFRIHPFFPAVPGATKWQDQYYADNYGVMYIDDIELVEFYGIK